MKSSLRNKPAVRTKMFLSTRKIVVGVAAIITAVSVGVFLFSSLAPSHEAQAAPVTLSGIVNSYAQVTNITTSSGRSVFTITNYSPCTGCSSATTDFQNGTRVLVIQMKGIGINTTNTSSYGAVTAYDNAGNHEMASVFSISGSGPYTVTLTTTTTKSYAVGGMVQLVTVPVYSDADINASGVTALAWNRTLGRGGIVAFDVTNNLTLTGNIDVSGLGFAGGSPNPGALGGCTNSDTYAANAASGFAQKGEGAAEYVAGSEYARGALANGGGGGNTHNAGGGGGGNLGSGGKGGQGWTGDGACTTSSDGGGLGGNNMNYNTYDNKIFMGGGGGGGQQNNAVASAGGNGGGIILIRANTLIASCSTTYGFYANGRNASNSGGNDAGGGGGAGGTIYLEVNAYSFGCTVRANANGGKGGDVNDGGAHGGGGGGGVGAVLVKNAPPAAASFASTQGTNGYDCNSGSCVASSSSVAGNPCPSGACTATGWSVSSTTALPITLLSFTAKAHNGQIQLHWVTLKEENNDHFTIERSMDAREFEVIATVKGAGTTHEKSAYAALDKVPLAGIAYYRLRQTDIDGTTTVSKIASVASEGSLNVEKAPGLTVNAIGPNPFEQSFSVDFDLASEGPVGIQLTDIQGRVFLTRTLDGIAGNNHYDFHDNQGLRPGIYFFRMESPTGSKVIRIAKR